MIYFGRNNEIMSKSKQWAYSSRGGYFQIHGFKHKIGGVGQLDDLSTHQTQLLVVIQHSVHVLNPDGIHRAVKDQPLPVWSLYNNKIYCFYRHYTQRNKFSVLYCFTQMWENLRQPNCISHRWAVFECLSYLFQMINKNLSQKESLQTSLSLVFCETEASGIIVGLNYLIAFEWD